MWSYKTIVSVATVGAILSRLGTILLAFKSAEEFKDRFEMNDENCRLVGQDIGMIGSEDVVLGKHGILFITSGDLRKTFDNGASEANEGSIFMMDLGSDISKKEVKEDHTETNIVKAKIHSSPFSQKEFRFQPHGMDVSNTTDRLYVVNHNNGYSSVIVFDVVYNEECLNTTAHTKCDLESRASLEFKTEIRSEMFPLMALNDVVEASSDEFYVTQWLPYAYPKRGKTRLDTIREYIEVLANEPYSVLFFNYRWTKVFHCKWDVKLSPQCKVASEERFSMANGVTISPDRKTVFVNDPLEMKITALSRNMANGELSKVYDIKLPTLVDNIEYDDEADEIILGTIIPGGMAVLSKTGSKDQWITKGVLPHDEKKLKQISAAARIGNSKIVLGSPFSEGILVCVN